MSTPKTFREFLRELQNREVQKRRNLASSYCSSSAFPQSSLSSSASFSSSASGLSRTQIHVPANVNFGYEIKQRLREQIMKELEEEGKIRSNSMLKPMTEERRKRKLDIILDKEKDE